MDTSTQEYNRLCAAVTECLNAHDLLGVLDLGAPADEYDPEMGDFVRLMTAGVTITPAAVATVWHKWFGTSSGDPSGEIEAPTYKMEALAADLAAVQRSFDRS